MTVALATSGALSLGALAVVNANAGAQSWHNGRWQRSSSTPTTAVPAASDPSTTPTTPATSAPSTTVASTVPPTTAPPPPAAPAGNGSSLAAPPTGTQLCPTEPGLSGGQQLGSDAVAMFASRYQSLPSLATVQADIASGALGSELSGYTISAVVNMPAGTNSPPTNAHTFYWFAPGIHRIAQWTLDNAQVYDTIYFGGGTANAPAIIDGGNTTNSMMYSYLGVASDVAFEYLTVRNYDMMDAGTSVVGEYEAGDRWIYKYNTFGPNDGYANSGTSGIPTEGALVHAGDGGSGADASPGGVIEYNCFWRNASAGLHGGNFRNGNPACNTPGSGYACKVNVFVDHNDFADNNYATFAGETPHGGWDNFGFGNLGVAAGAKAWWWWNSTFSNNYVHDNHGVGIWYDTINVNNTITGNYFERNWAYGVMYEVSYNPEIRNNTFVDNGWVSSAQDMSPDIRGAGVWLSESGYDSRLPNDGTGYSEIAHNTFTDNWNGVTLKEVEGRYCTNGTPTSECTQEDGSQTAGQPGNSVSPYSKATLTSCAQDGVSGHLGTGANIATGAAGAGPNAYGQYAPNNFAPGTLVGDCRWQVKNVHVTNNVFSFDPNNINAVNLLTIEGMATNVAPGKCMANATTPTPNQFCGFNMIMSDASSTSAYPSWSVAHSIVFDQGNYFGNNPSCASGCGNSYFGPWHFFLDSCCSVILPNFGFVQWQTAAGSRPSSPGVPNYEGDNGTTLPNRPPEDAGSSCGANGSGVSCP